MPRLAPLDLDALTPDQKAVADAIRSGPRQGIRGPFEAWIRIPAFASHAQEIGSYCRFASSLPGDVREMAILLTGKQWRAQYEFWAHARLAREAGLPNHVIDAIRIGKPPDLDRDDLQVAFALTTEYFATNRVGAETYGRAQGIFGDAGVMDLIATIGYYGLVSMTLNVFDIALPEGETLPFEE